MNMKTLLALLACITLCGCTGCQGPRTLTPLQPGDCVIFKGDDANARANDFRTNSLNDLNRTGNVVEITRLPATIETQ